MAELSRSKSGLRIARCRLAMAVLATLGVGAEGGRGASAVGSEAQSPGASPAAAASLQTITARDLLELRDLAGLSVSPDGRYVAFQVQQADLERNRYRSAWFVAEIRQGAPPRQVSRDNEPDLATIPAGRRTGVSVVLSARWSPDSLWIAYLCGDGERTQVCRSHRDDEGSERLTRVTADVTDLVWSADGKSIVFSVDRTRVLQESQALEEGEHGFLLDDRFDVFHSWTPVRLGTQDAGAARSIWTHEIVSGIERRASPKEIEWFDQRRPSPTIRHGGSHGASRAVTIKSESDVRQPASLAGRGDVRYVARSADRQLIALLEPAEATQRGLNPPLAVRVMGSASIDGVVECGAAECRGLISDLWWTADRRELVFLKREGWAFGTQGLYAWSVATKVIRRILTTTDLISDCDPSPQALICLMEGSTEPRKLVSIDLRSGEVTDLFDPNPGFQHRLLAPAHRLEWTTGQGDPIFGYLVLPVGGIAHPPYPLVIVQYRARGFLRGGVGDEYPIQLFAAHGLAALVVERPEPWAALASEADADRVELAEWQNLNERRRTLSAVDAGIDLALRRYPIDPCRIGITGLSDGAETATFALFQSNRFAAASLSSGGWEPLDYYFTTEQRRRRMAAVGLGPIGTPFGGRWPQASLPLNAERMTTPLLIQAADRELVLLMQLYVTLKDAGKPIEVYVFPDEYHVKWQPRHRLHIYARNLDWFRYWLQNTEDADSRKRAQYERWRRMEAHVDPLRTASTCGYDRATARIQ